MALAQRQEFSAIEIIDALETSGVLPQMALRQAVACAGAIAPAVISVVEQAANRVYLIPKQTNLLIRGIHALAAARRTELYRPLLRLLRHLNEAGLDRLFGDTTTETLPGVFISVFDGDAASLIEACCDDSVDGLARWVLLEVLARLTFDGHVPRQLTIDLLGRFERENLAKSGDLAWEGWQQAIILLGVEELRERLHATWSDGRNRQRKVDRAACDQDLSKARAMAPNDPALFVQHRLAAIDDPVAALQCCMPKPGAETDALRVAPGLHDPDPAELIALTPDETNWLAGYFDHVHSAGFFELVDGFFCGLIAGPGTAKPSEYLSKIWGVDGRDGYMEPRHENAVQAEYVTNLLTRHWSTIAQRLDRGHLHTPVLEDPFGLPEASFWAMGFLFAITLRQGEWQKRSGDEFISMLIVGLMSLAERKHALSAKLKPNERAKIVDSLPLMVQSTFNVWHGGRDPLARPSILKHLDHKVPRNARCPCGSGKKFKRCCGSAVNPTNN